ncbi:NUDIX domain-containing protein [Streptococcus cristatus]|uniref:NUDIX hydrolase n=1 Tax=Streptococcus cristatus TaxID=45634 RepID=UPI0039C087C8
MNKDYISYIRSKVGHDKVILNFAGGILADEDGRVLLQLRGDKKTWAIPGGAMEIGETSLQAAVREFHEETGIAVEAKRLLNVYTNFDESYPNGDKVQTVVFLYELQALENVDISNFHNEETLCLGFFSKEEIAELENVSNKHRLMLDEYFSDSFAMGL